MNQETRVKYFDKLKSTSPYSHKNIYYQGQMQKLPVFKIDLNYLVYNRWNGRIASLVKTYEMENGVELDASDSQCYEIIEKFLMESNISANKATFANIKEQGQKEYGIVTKDGVIIDGNRRAMLLKRKAHELNESPAYFLAVVLEEKLADNVNEIMRLETTYQMGEDAKVDYEPIEKYLKCKDMENAGFSKAEIGKAMNEHESKIGECLEIMELMNEYLDWLGYKGIYTRLDKTEDLFINLNKVYRRWEKTHGRVTWNHKENDLSDFKLICFDFIRYVYNAPKPIQAKEVRDFLIRNSEESFFAHQKIWEDLIKRHRSVDEFTKSEKSVNQLRAESGSRGLSSLLKSRDVAWAEQVDSIMKENFGRARESLGNLQDKAEPLKLLQSALDKLEAIDIESQAFLDDEGVFTAIDTIRKTADEYKKAIIVYRKRK
jgi:hypothetical protein